MIKNMTQTKWKMIGLILLGTGLAGGIFFFPVNINSQYTCLYHRLTSGEHHSSMMGQKMERHHKNISTSEYDSSARLTPDKFSGENNQENTELLHRYILPFGFIWWFSLSLIFWGGILLKRILQKKNKSASVLKYR